MKRTVGGQEYARYKEMGKRDFESALRLLIIRDMIYHRGLTIDDLVKEMGCSKTWFYHLTSGKAWYRIPVVKHDAWLDRAEDAITRLTDSQGGVYGNCKCDPSSIEGIREVLSHAHAPQALG